MTKDIVNRAYQYLTRERTCTCGVICTAEQIVRNHWSHYSTLVRMQQNVKFQMGDNYQCPCGCADFVGDDTYRRRYLWSRVVLGGHDSYPIYWPSQMSLWKALGIAYESGVLRHGPIPYLISETSGTSNETTITWTDQKISTNTQSNPKAASNHSHEKTRNIMLTTHTVEVIGGIVGQVHLSVQSETLSTSTIVWQSKPVKIKKGNRSKAVNKAEQLAVEAIQEMFADMFTSHELGKSIDVSGFDPDNFVDAPPPGAEGDQGLFILNLMDDLIADANGRSMVESLLADYYRTHPRRDDDPVHDQDDPAEPKQDG